MALLDGAAYVGEHVVRVGTDQPDSAYNDDKNYRQHYRILRDILTTLIIPKISENICHGLHLLEKCFNRTPLIVTGDRITKTVTRSFSVPRLVV